MLTYVIVLTMRPLVSHFHDEYQSIKEEVTDPNRF